MQPHTFHIPGPFPLEGGGYLPELRLTYSTAGHPDPDRSNVVWVCHALTGSWDFASWWPGMFGPGEVFDPARYYIICVNIPGSCYGSTDALSVNPETGEPYYHDFPLITNRDIVEAFERLRVHLGIRHIEVAIGGSLGGQHVIEWAVSHPDLISHIIPIATNARHSPWGIACNEAQRMAISADPTWQERHPAAGLTGMRAARAMAMLTYRTYETYAVTQTDDHPDLHTAYRAATYQQYQGEKLARRFHAFAYWSLSRAMDSHDVGRGRGGIAAALAQVRARALVIGIQSDILFPVQEQQEIARLIPGAQYEEIHSLYGHDGFLVEIPVLTHLIRAFRGEPVVTGQPETYT
ncbi:MAG: homoserine O-acetyltransferase [Bacteroidia bacterium]|nr:homoserine O-acetyltransferase [Bacteroidia bacterium]